MGMITLDHAQSLLSGGLRGTLRHVPLPVVRWNNRRTLPILIFHAVESSPKPHIRHLYDCHTPKSFEQVLDEALRHFKPLQDLSPEGIVGADADHFLVTFDDGLRSAYEVALPILERKGIPAIHFLITDFLSDTSGRKIEQQFKASLLIETLRQANTPLRQEAARILAQAGYPGDPASTLLKVRKPDTHVFDQVARMLSVDLNSHFAAERPYINLVEAHDMARRGFVLGAHSCNHARYWELDLHEQVRQTRDSMQFIESTFSVPGRYFAFPYKNRGIRSAFYAATRDDVDLFFTTSGWGSHMHRQGILHRVGMDHQPSTVAALKMGWRPFPLSLVQ